MDGFREIQKVTLRKLKTKLECRGLQEKITVKEADYDTLEARTLDNLINYYNSLIKEFDESGKYPLFN